MAKLKPEGLFAGKRERKVVKADISIEDSTKDIGDIEIDSKSLEQIEKNAEKDVPMEEHHLMKEFIEGSKLISDANKRLLLRLKEYDRRLETLKDLESENAALRQNISDKDSFLAGLNQAINDLKEENSKLKGRIDDKNQIIIKINEELKSFREQQNKSKAAIESLKTLESENTSLKQSLTDKESIVAELNKAFSELRNEAVYLKSKLEEKNQIIVKVSDDAAAAKEQQIKSQVIIDSLKKQIDDGRRLLRDQAGRISSLSAKPIVNEPKKSVFSENEVVEQIRKESEKESKLLHEMYKDLERLKERNIRKENIITALKGVVEKLELRSKEKDKVILGLNNTIGALRMRGAQLEKDIDEHQNGERLLRDQIKDLTRKIDELKEEISEKDGYYPLIAELEKQNIEADKEEFLRSVESELILLRAENKRLTTDINQLEAEISKRKEKEKEILAKLKTIVISEDVQVKKPADLLGNRKLKEILDLLAVSLASGDSIEQARKALVKLGYDDKMVNDAIRIRNESL